MAGAGSSIRLTASFGRNCTRYRLGLDGALVAQHVLVVAARIDEARARGVGLRGTARVVTHVVRHGAGDDEDQAWTRMRVPAGRPARSDLVVDHIDVGLAVRPDRRIPADGPQRQGGADVDRVEERLCEDRRRQTRARRRQDVPGVHGDPQDNDEKSQEPLRLHFPSFVRGVFSRGIGGGAVASSSARKTSRSASWSESVIRCCSHA